jgi:GDPmannose 4,6-dehydratase
MRVLVTGCTGSDGHIAAKKLEAEGHEVFGLVRDQKVQSIPHGTLVRGDLTDSGSIARLISEYQFHEIYNLGAWSHAGLSFQEPAYVLEVNGKGPLHIFEAVKRFSPNTRVYQASTSEMFGNGPMPANEETPFTPVNPYGAAKLYAHEMAHIYRQMGVWVSCGILFNHVSSRHYDQFLPGKVARAAAAIKRGEQQKLFLGHLHPRRDWGWAPEFVEGIFSILRHTEPDDFVLATGTTCTVQAMAEEIFRWFDLSFGEYIELAAEELRPVELLKLQGDATKAERVLGWKAKILWPDVARLLAEEQMALVGVA